MGACWKFGYNSLSGREVMVTIAIIISAPKCSISLIFIMFFVLTLYISISHTLTKIFKWIRAKGTSVYSTTLMLNLHILEQQHWYRNRCLCCRGICECVCVRVSVYHLCVYALSMHRRSRRFRLKFGLINDGAIILRCERILFSCQDILSFRDCYPPPPSHFVVYACIIGPGLVAKHRRTLGRWTAPVRLSVRSHRAGICVIYF